MSAPRGIHDFRTIAEIDRRAGGHGDDDVVYAVVELVRTMNGQPWPVDSRALRSVIAHLETVARRMSLDESTKPGGAR
jgi:hypothetical protein